MIDNTLTRNEARVLQAIRDDDGSYVYELAAVAQLTPADVLDAAERLDARGFLKFDREKRFVMVTSEGSAVRNDLASSSLGDPNFMKKRSYEIAPTEGAPAYEEMSSNEVEAAIDAEIERYEE